MYPVLTNRSTWIEVNLEQLKKNLIYVKKSAKNKHVFAVVKSNAYNHGIEGVFTTFISAGIRKFCVAQYDEAVHLQQIANFHQEQIEILIFGSIPISKMHKVLENWHISITNQKTIDEIIENSQNNNFEHLKVHVKIDSGMNRRGFKTKESFLQACTKMQQYSFFQIEGLYTHFSTSDCDEDFMHKQVETFKKIIEPMQEKVKYIHAQNSYGVLNLDDDFFNLIRPGGICYGMTGVEHPVCKPIFSLYTKITDKKSVSPDEVVGYGNTYTFDSKGFVGVLPIGYADGWRKKNTGLTVFVNGNACQIVGKICMEQCMIFSTKEVFEEDDIVELVGKHNNIFVLAQYNNICDYEFVCSFLNRIPRKYKEKEVR